MSSQLDLTLIVIDGDEIEMMRCRCKLQMVLQAVPVILDAKRPMIPVPVPGYELYGAKLNSHKTKFAFLVYVKNKENFLN